MSYCLYVCTRMYLCMCVYADMHFHYIIILYEEKWMLVKWKMFICYKFFSKFNIAIGIIWKKLIELWLKESK